VSAPRGRVDLEALKRPRLGGKEPSDDDYRFSLDFQFVSLWRGAGEPLSFFLPSSSTQSTRIGSQFRWAQLGTVVGVIRAEHGEKGMQEFSHDGHYRLQGGLSAS